LQSPSVDAYIPAERGHLIYRGGQKTAEPEGNN